MVERSTGSRDPQPSAGESFTHSILAGAGGSAWALVPFVLWAFVLAPAPFSFSERAALAGGLFAAYFVAGAVIGALVGLVFALLGVKRGWGSWIAAALAGGLALAAWSRPLAGDSGCYLVGAFGLPLFAWLGTRRVALFRVPLFALIAASGLVGLLVFGLPEGAEFAPETRRARLSPGAGDASGAWAPALERPRNVILIVVDTLRADHLSAYGYERETSPVLDSLAAEGVLFDAAIVQRPKTSPSVASILTGLYPHTHGLTGTRSQLPHELDTLAEHYRRAGYETAGFVANINLFRRFQFDQGFETYEQYGARGKDHAALVNEGVFAWLAERERAGRDDPFFLYVHYMDPHTPYAPPAGFDEDRFVGDALYGRHAHLDVPIGDGYIGMLDRHLVLEGDSREIDLYVARYDAEIAYCDREIGHLIAYLRARGLLDESMLVVTSDHGESMTEHGVFFNHGLFPYENNVRVPLIVRHPAFEAGRRVADVVQSIDLAPTLLDASGLDLPAAIEGETILPLLLGEEGKSLDAAFAEAGESHGGSLITSLRTRESKLIAFRRRAPTWYEEGMGIVGVLREAAFDPGRFYDFMAAFELEGGREHERELYDIASDPDEEVNLVEERPGDARALGERLAPFREAAFELRPDTRIDESEMDEETLDTLKSLGYVQ